MLMLSKKFKELSDAFPEDWVPCDDDDAEDGNAADHDRQQEHASLARSIRRNNRAQKDRKDRHAKQQVSGNLRCKAYVSAPPVA